MVMRHVPFLAKYYRFAFHQRASRKAELFLFVPLQKLFRVVRALGLFPRRGEFDYERLGKISTVRYISVFMHSHAKR